jgi:hydroxymethylpyrimidine pyrophosphatase-like HAD family hydrolase
VLDIHPPCRGKGEALRVLEELYGIPAARVVAVGDATNDIPMFELAGLSVAMENSMGEALAVAQRVIGSNNGPAIAELVEELFLAPARPIAEAG